MHRSKLELYEEILQTLAKKPLILDSIAYTCNMDCRLLNQRLSFLVKNGLVQEENFKNKTRYALTKRGTAISKTLAITKRLEKLQHDAPLLNDSLQALPAIFNKSENKTTNTKQNQNC
ncbi:MAG: winged helix-turn-helix domain-containing protein [Candidatus Bathyarchaeota archaeon]|nr:winged helix-turn-helix domain-containing protein [Candidatus Bathyarchaeota archaeon]